MSDEEKSEKKWPYFAPFELVTHNRPDDCWVSFLGKVFNVSQVIQLHAGERCIKPLLTMAGKDISHWFDEKTGDIQHYIHPETGCNVPYCPHGPIPDVSVPIPATDWRPLGRPPWWHDEQLSKYFSFHNLLFLLFFSANLFFVCIFYPKK